MMFFVVRGLFFLEVGDVGGNTCGMRGVFGGRIFYDETGSVELVILWRK